MAFNFSALFTPERAMQGMQGVQAINRMPWVFSGYGPPAAPSAAPVVPQAAPAASPFPGMIGDGNAAPDVQEFWRLLMQNQSDPNGGGA
jgi:anti-sigma factor RsiW